MLKEDNSIKENKGNLRGKHNVAASTNGVTVQGTKTRTKNVDLPPPPAPVALSKTSNATSSSASRKAAQLLPVPVKSKVEGIAGIVQEINSDSSYQLIMYGIISIVGAVVLAVVIVGCLIRRKKRSAIVPALFASGYGIEGM